MSACSIQVEQPASCCTLLNILHTFVPYTKFTGTHPATLIRNRRSNTDDTLIALSSENKEVLKRSKRGFFRWIKNLFHKKQPEPEPAESEYSPPVPQSPRRASSNRQQQPRDRDETTTHRSRPPPEVIGSSGKNNPKSVVVHERPVYIPRSTTTPSSRVVAHMPQEPVHPEPGTEPHNIVETPSATKQHTQRPTEHKNHEKAEEDNVDKLLPVPMRSTHMLGSSSIRTSPLNHEESSKRNQEYAAAEEEPSRRQDEAVEAEETDYGRDKRSKNILDFYVYGLITRIIAKN